MKILKVLFMGSLILSLGSLRASAGWMDKLKAVVPSFMQTGLGETQVGKALRQALEVGVDHAVKSASQKDGFYKNEAIKIPFPEKLSFVETALRTMGMGSKIDAFEMQMNRAAESASPKAKKILLDALFEMSIEDADGILNGGQTAATQYFDSKARDELYSAFEPYLAKSMQSYKVVEVYNQLLTTYDKIPFASKPTLESVESYGTNRALDGLFHLIAQEEIKIRTDPEARVTELLKKVFSK